MKRSMDYVVSNAEQARRTSNGGFPMQMTKEERLARHETLQTAAVINHGVVLTPEEAAEIFHTINDTFVTCEPEEVAVVQANDPDAIIWKGRKHTKIEIYGKEGIPHRDVVAFASFNTEGQHSVYRFGTGSKGVVWRPCAKDTRTPYDMKQVPCLGKVLDRIEQKTGERPNFCVVTRYVGGYDSIGDHHDKVVDLVPGKGIQMVSLGASRNFVVTHPDIPNRQFCEKHATRNGELLTLPWESNIVYKHCVRRESNATGTRISLIFRSMKTWFDPGTQQSYWVDHQNNSKRRRVNETK